MNYSILSSRRRFCRVASPLAGQGASAKLAAAVALALTSAAIAPAPAQQFVIQPTTEAVSLDTKIYSGTPNGNFSSNLNITSADIGAAFFGLVQFDLSTVTASAESISSASLTLFSTGVGASGGPAVGGTVTLRPILNAWSEDAASVTPPGATYNAFFGTTPTLTLGGVIASQTVTTGGFVNWDITSTVKSWLSGSLANHGVLIALSTGSGDIGFADVDSNPETPGSSPQLTVTVPEPSSLAALATGAGWLSFVLLRRRRPTS